MTDTTTWQGPELNVPLLRKVHDQIVAEPKTWRQDSWATDLWDTKFVDGETVMEVCGTAHCFAGWAATFDGGWEPTRDVSDRVIGGTDLTYRRDNLVLDPELTTAIDTEWEVHQTRMMGAPWRDCRRRDAAGKIELGDYSEIGRDVLGLTDLEASLLFDANNNLTTIEYLLHLLAGDEFPRPTGKMSYTMREHVTTYLSEIELPADARPGVRERFEDLDRQLREENQ